MVRVRIKTKDGEAEGGVPFLEACSITNADEEPCIDLTATDFDINIVKLAVGWPCIDMPVEGSSVAALMNFADYIGHESLVTDCAKAFAAIIRTASPLSHQLKDQINMLNFGPKLVVLDHADFEAFNMLRKYAAPYDAQYKAVVSRTLQHNEYIRSRDFYRMSGAKAFKDLASFQKEMATNSYWIAQALKQAITGADQVKRIAFTPDCKRLLVQYMRPRKLTIWHIGPGRAPNTYSSTEIHDAADFGIVGHRTLILYCRPARNERHYLRMLAFDDPEVDCRFELTGGLCLSIEMRGVYLGLSGTHEYNIVNFDDEESIEQLSTNFHGQIRLCDHACYAFLDAASSIFSIRKVETHETKHTVQIMVPSTKRLIAVQISPSKATIIAVFDSHVACWSTQAACWFVGAEVGVQGLALISVDCRFVVLQVANPRIKEGEVRTSSLATYQFHDGKLSLLYKLDNLGLHFTPLAISPDNTFLLNSRQSLGGSWSTTIQVRNLVTGRVYSPA